MSEPSDLAKRLAEHKANYHGVCRQCKSKHPCDAAEACAGLAALQAENERLRGSIETLVADEVISAGRARELHGMTCEEQRAHWRDRCDSERNDALSEILDELAASQTNAERLRGELTTAKELSEDRHRFKNRYADEALTLRERLAQALTLLEAWPAEANCWKLRDADFDNRHLLRERTDKWVSAARGEE